MSYNINWLSKEFDNARNYWNMSFTNVNIDSIAQKDIDCAKGYAKSKIFELDQEISHKLDIYCNHQPNSTFIWFCTIIDIMIYKITNQDNVTLASVSMNRESNGSNENIVFNEKVDKDLTFKQMLMKVKKNVLEAYQYQYYPIELVCETYGVEMEEIWHIRVEYNKFNLSQTETNYELFFVFDQTDIGIYSICVHYHKSKFEESYINKIIEILSNLFTISVNDINCKIVDMELLAKNEISNLLKEYCRGDIIKWQYKTLVEAFRHVVNTYPERTALVQGDNYITYFELDQLSEHIANQLQNYDIKRNDIVALYGENSIEMVVLMLAVLKAGGCYLPIDSEYPIERMEYILLDSKAKLLLTCKKNVIVNVVYDGIILSYEKLAAEGFVDKTEYNLNETDVAYVIYTSGTTGNPKGVVISHKGICNYVFWRIRHYKITEKDVTIQLLSTAFDGYCSNLYTSILSGGKLIIPKISYMKDYKHISELIINHMVTGLSCVPVIYQAILDNMKNLHCSLRYVVLAGESTSAKLVEESRQAKPMLQLINEYGPTENSVASTYLMNIEGNNIGNPIANQFVMILNQDGNMMPVGFKGELCVAGAGLANGYLNKEELTEKKFVLSRYFRGQKIYKTGDLASWNYNGNIELYGRTDRQVKINGHRIELEEVEKILSIHNSIEYSAVIVESNESTNCLVAFYVADIEVERKELRNHMKQFLPEYMIPGKYCRVENFFLTNGKVDYRKLESLAANNSENNNIVKPESEIEEKIFEIWVKVLKKRDFGIRNNFFTLGGDSISTIQVSSMLRDQGLMIKPQDIFEFPTIEELSKHTVQMYDVLESIENTGIAKLTPIQKWFLESGLRNKNHFVQCIVLKSEKFELELVKNSMLELYRRHDALRMKYNITDNIMEQERIPFEDSEINIKLLDIDSASDINVFVVEQVRQFTNEINIYEGKLAVTAIIRVLHVDYLVLVFHHLAVDGVSMRIILEEFTDLYEANLKKRKCEYYKTASFITYVNKLNSKEVLGSLWQDKEYWTEISGLANKNMNRNIVSTYNDMERLIFEFSDKKTELLLQNANKAYTTNCRDLILTALAKASKMLFGRNNIVIETEGHGREDIIEDIDIVRTVGWFTSKYPILLNLSENDEYAYDICSVKESVRRIPNNGSSYGLIKYLDPNCEFPDIIPDVSFNYLGQFKEDKEGFIQITNIAQGLHIDQDEIMLNKIEVIALISGGKLTVTVNYGGKDFIKNEIEIFVDYFRSYLDEIIDHCINKKGKTLTQSDYGCTQLTNDELEDVVQMILSINSTD